MDSSGNNGRTYNEQEIARLIERASEIQAKTADAPDRSLSLEEVGQIAADLGVSARALREAALELEAAPDSKKRFSLTGAPPVSHSRVADGVLTARDWDHVRLELQRYSGSDGQSSEVGDARIWSHSLGEGPEGMNLKTTRVTVQPVDGHTTVQVREDYGGATLAYGMSFFFASFLSLMVAHSLPDVSKLAELAIAGSGGLASLGVTRALIGASVRRQRDRLSGLADRLVRAVGGGQALSPSSAADLDAAAAQAGPVSDEGIGLPKEEDPARDFSGAGSGSTRARRARS